MKTEINTATVTTEGKQLNGAEVLTVESFGIAEDGRTLIVMLELANGSLVCYQFCSGEPITAHVVAASPIGRLH